MEKELAQAKVDLRTAEEARKKAIDNESVSVLSRTQ